MCIRHIVTQFGIPVTFDDKREPAFSGLRKTLGLCTDEEEDSDERDSTSLTQPPRAMQTTPRLTAPNVPSFMASGRSYKMGCGMGGRKLIRGY